MAVATAPKPVLHLQYCTYTSCYCEENVYLLLKQLVEQHDRSGLFAVFISNANETVPFCYQRASQHPDGFVVWDYHVIALEVRTATPAGVLVWDLGLHHPHLPFPCTLQQYVDHALQTGAVQLPQQFQRMFRLVPASSLLQYFASDRSHMRRPDGSWCAEPPPYPCITAADGGTMNLGRYRNMQIDVLPDRIQHTMCDTTRHLCTAASAAASAATSYATPAAATGEADGPESDDNIAAGPVQHPCKPAAGISQGQTVQGLQSGQECGVGTMHDHTCTQNEATPACASPPAATGDEAGREGGWVTAEGPANAALAHSTAAGVGTITEAATLAFRLVTWDDVVRAAHSSRFGVVVQEDTLLRCLLGEAS